jgi:hypothetical protein
MFNSLSKLVDSEPFVNVCKRLLLLLGKYKVSVTEGTHAKLLCEIITKSQIK